MSDFLRKVQLIELDILKEFDRVCKENGINYFIAQGTLLGAAKYKGFIPWDDDIDVILDYKNLKKLKNIFSEKAEKKYMYTSYTEEKHFPLPWSKIRAKDTLSRPARYKDLPINWGICIDLFPLYYLSNNSLVRKAECFFIKVGYKLLMAEMTKFEEGHGFLTRLLEKVPIGLRHFYCNLLLKHLDKNKDDSNYIWITSKGGKVVERSLIFGEPTRLPFEDADYPVPTKYHEYLTGFYGDYMAPLPESEQKGHDLTLGEIEWKL